MALELSSVAAVGHFFGLTEPFSGEDAYDLQEALDVGREQITARVLPASQLPDPLPASLHRACTMRSAEILADNPQRFGYQTDVDGEGSGPPPAKYLIRDLIAPWALPSGGMGPDNSVQVFDVC